LKIRIKDGIRIKNKNKEIKREEGPTRNQKFGSKSQRLFRTIGHMSVLSWVKKWGMTNMY